jgi:hypothetical protein
VLRRPTNLPLHVFFTVGAALGTEIFFITWLPWLCWFWSFDVFRRVIVLWGAMMYSGQLLKEILRLPRPPRHLVFALESHYAEEYGMPSTHAMNALCMSCSWAAYSMNRFSGPTWVLCAVALLWFVSCTFSRLYKGAHSPADVIVGLVLASTFLLLSFLFGDAVDSWILTSPHVVWAVPALLAALCAAYPRPKKPRWISSPGDTVIIEGVVCGVLLGVNAHNAAHVAAIGSPIDFTSVDLRRVAVAAASCILGFTVLVAVRFAVKAAASAALLAYWGPLWVDAQEMDSVADLHDQDVSRKKDDADAAAAAAAEADPSAVSPSSSSTQQQQQQQDVPPLTVGGAMRDASGDSGASSPRSGSSESDPCDDSAAAPVVSRRRTEQRDAPSYSSSSRAPVPMSPKPVPPAIGANRVLVPPNKRYEIELPCKGVTYTAVGFCAVYVVPLLFQALGVAQYGM